MTKEEFLKYVKITEDQFYGKKEIEDYLYLQSLTSIPEDFNPTVGGGLHLGSLTSIPKGFNPTVGGVLDLGNLTSIPKGFNPIVRGAIYLQSLTSIPEGFNPIVGGGLHLGSLTSIPEGFNPTVGGYLDLGSLTSIPKDFNPIVGGSIDLGSLTSIPEGFTPTVGDSLYLGSLTSIPEGFNPTVGDSLDLRSLTSIPKDFNPTIGGYLYLGSLTSTPDGFNPTVGGYLDLNEELKKGIKINTPNPLMSWQGGKYVKVDGIFTEVLNVKGNVKKVKRIGQDKEFYLVTDGNGNYAHGDTIQEAKEDLIYKLSKRDKTDYQGLSKDHKLTFQESIQCYRTITGACSAGVKSFIKSNNIENRDYTIAEIQALTKGAYGSSDFQNFFN
jgi:hypothetical protein